MLAKIGKFISALFSSSDEQSFGRFASFLCLSFCLGWDTAYIVFVMRHFKEFHFVAGDLLAYGGVLISQGGFCSLFYGVNKVTGMGVFNKGNPPSQQ